MYKVFLVEDESIIREKIRNSIQWDESVLDYVGDAPDGEMALAMIQELKPDIVLTDIEMPFMGGLELSRIIKETMPWIHVIIISGHDDFEYAQEAISIKVDRYLLKPIDRVELEKALLLVVEDIEESRRTSTNLDRIYDRLASVEQLRKKEFLEQVVSGVLETRLVLSRSGEFGISLIARKYLVAEVSLEADACSDANLIAIQGAVQDVLDAAVDAEWIFRLPGTLVIIIKGEDSEALSERAYALLSGLKYRLESDFSTRVSVAIGSIVHRIGELSTSYAEARKAAAPLFKGKIVSAADLENPDISNGLVVSGEASLREKLKYADAEDEGALIPDYPSGGGKDGILTAYYRLASLFVDVQSFIGECRGHTEEVPASPTPSELLEYAESKEAFHKVASEAINRAMACRDGSGTVKHRRVIVRARRFIRENFSDPMLSLGKVADHVALSPNHFSTVFSQETGETFVEYLTRVRIEQARNLMTDESRKLGDIALEVGYNEAHYFSFLFKKAMGITPSEYRASRG